MTEQTPDRGGPMPRTVAEAVRWMRSASFMMRSAALVVDPGQPRSATEATLLDALQRFDKLMLAVADEIDLIGRLTR